MIHTIHAYSHVSLPQEPESAFKLTVTQAVNSASVAFLNTKSKGQPTTAATSFFLTGKVANISPAALGVYKFCMLASSHSSQGPADQWRATPGPPLQLPGPTWNAGKQPLQLFISCPYFSTSQPSQESPQSPGCSANCQAAFCRLASPVLAQLLDQRKSLESGKETSLVQWMEEFTRLKQGPRVTLSCVWQKAGRMWRQALLLGEEVGYQSQTELKSVGKLAKEHKPHFPFHKLSQWR